MEIRARNAKKEEVLKEMELEPVLRNGLVIDCVLDLVAGVKAIFKLVSTSNK